MGRREAGGEGAGCFFVRVSVGLVGRRGRSVCGGSGGGGGGDDDSWKRRWMMAKKNSCACDMQMPNISKINYELDGRKIVITID